MTDSVRVRQYTRRRERPAVWQQSEGKNREDAIRTYRRWYADDKRWRIVAVRLERPKRDRKYKGVKPYLVGVRLRAKARRKK
jgi:hypothetical protein